MFRLLIFFFALAIRLPLSGQTVLFQDDFNGCTGLAPGWTVSIDGNQNFIWYVGTPKNPKCDSTSIDGTCMLVMDDDATGNNTPALTANFRTPVFDGRGFATILLEVDVHYRDLGNLDDHFDIVLTDGTSEHVLARFDNKNATGSQFSQHISFSSDLSLYSQNENMQIIFRYSDAGGYAWWAGIDNVRISGIGEGSPVVVETFDSCALPAGWNAEIVTGDFDWFYTPPPSTRYGAGASMNGSCFVLFDDDYIGQAAKPSLLRLATPWFDGSEYATFQLSFELIFRWYISEIFSVYVESGDGERSLVASWPGAVGGPAFSNFVRESFDISQFRHKQMRVVFEYDDGGSWGWWVGLDNVKISGHGEAHDLCSKSIELQRDQSCQHGDNKTSIFEGPVPTCSEINNAGMWYRWMADTTGWMEAELTSDFNDVISVFTGNCDSLAWVTCGNKDKYGFNGEKTFFQAQAGTLYFLRISGGTNEGFGSLRGEYCLRLYSASPPQSESNDPCAGAIPLVIGNDCLPGKNLHASALNPYPSRNLRADADVWYTFTAPDLQDDEILRLESKADFSDVLTLYEGSCVTPGEVKGTEFGQQLDIDHLIAGQTYFLQVAGNFATIEGDFCIKASIVPKAVAPPNDECFQAQPILLNTDCTEGSLIGATFSGIHPPCIVSTQRDAWFSFIAPLDGGMQIIVDADFKENATVWGGACNNLSVVRCLQHLLRCDGYQKITGLVPGETYYLQISSTGAEQGNFCIRLIDGNTSPPFNPLRLSVRNLCIGQDSSLLLLDAFNGQLPYTWLGTPHQQLLYTGEEYNVVVRDAMGCEQSISGIVPECEAAVSCAMDLQFVGVDPACADSHDGSVTVEANNGNDPYLYVWNIPEQIENRVDHLGEGIYAVTVYDDSGCTATGSFTLQAPPPITITILQLVNPTGGEQNGFIEAGFAGGTGELSVYWYDKDGALLANASSLSAIGSGQYTVVVVDANGCSASQTVSLEVTSVDKPESKSGMVEIVPNPAKGKAFILVHHDLKGKCDIQVTDPSGRQVQIMKGVEVQMGQVALDIRAYPAGTYFVRIDIDGKIFTKRLLVVRN